MLGTPRTTVTLAAGSLHQMDFSAWFEVYLEDRWWTFDARHNARRTLRCRSTSHYASLRVKE